MSAPSRRLVLCGLIAIAIAPGANADDSTLRLIFPFSAGGAADGAIRRIGEHVGRQLGRTVIVDNRTGAGGRIGALAVRDAAPDGSTLLVAAGAQMYLQPHAYANLGYDPLVDLPPVSQLVTFSQGLAINAEIPARSLQELADWIKANPERGSFGSPGAGTAAHFAGIELGRKIGRGLNHVPYRGTPAALPDLMTGRLPIYIASAAELIEQHNAGKVRLLALLDAEPSPLFDGIPTLREQGFDIVAPGWFAVHAPKGTPLATVQRFEEAFAKAVRDPEVASYLKSLRFRSTGTTAAELLKAQQAEFERWGLIVKASGFKGEL
jgi:tripartite-type tricarboxylate transporter receptor subunit TctC